MVKPEMTLEQFQRLPQGELYIPSAITRCQNCGSYCIISRRVGSMYVVRCGDCGNSRSAATKKAAYAAFLRQTWRTLELDYRSSESWIAAERTYAENPTETNRAKVHVARLAAGYPWVTPDMLPPSHACQRHVARLVSRRWNGGATVKTDFQVGMRVRTLTTWWEIVAIPPGADGLLYAVELSASGERTGGVHVIFTANILETGGSGDDETIPEVRPNTTREAR